MKRLSTAAVVGLLTLAACGGGGNKAKSSTTSSLSTSTTEMTGVTTTSVTTYSGLGGSATTAKPGASGGSTATTSKPTQANGAPAPATPGTYDFSQSGTSSTGPVPANGSIIADAPNGAGVQVWHIASDASQPAENDETLAFRPSGPFLTDVAIHTGPSTITCHFDGDGVAAPPWPADTGKPISGHANCGQVTVDVAGSVTGHHTATVAGQPIDVIDTHFTITTHGQVESTATTDASWAPSIRMIVHDHTVTSGRYGAIAFQSDTTRDLLRTTPR